ncbi:MAG: PAS domain S-box protein [Desulfobacteraceae bacterium]|nr:PAS domain S-box protein [Desulfobacteraceae bacterium]
MRIKLPSSAGSIYMQTLLWAGFFTGLVVIAITGISYVSMVAFLKEQALANLEKHAIHRGQIEESIFLLAKDNHGVLGREIIRRLEEFGDRDPVEAFDKLFVREDDGAVRSRPEAFHGAREACVFIGKGVEINADVRRRVLVCHEVCSRFGPALRNRFQDTYISTPDNIMVVYWPEVPDWCRNAPADFYAPGEEFARIADKEHNPLRKTVWTGLIYDKMAETWMVSCETPVDLNGRHIATIGHDITLNELVDRTLKDTFSRSYNMIFRPDGRLIAHPGLMEKIKEKNGRFHIPGSGDSHLSAIWDTVIREQGQRVLMFNKEYDEYIAAIRLKGSGWYFVTVFPASLVTGRASGSARLVLIAGLIVLIAEAGILFFIIRNRVGAPLQKFVNAAEQLAAGDFSIRLDEKRNDELGLLARSFSHMRDAVADKMFQLRESEERFKSLAGNIPGIVYRSCCDADWTMQFVSRVVEEITGYPASDFLRDSVRTYASIIHPDDSDMVENVIRESIEQKRPFMMEYRIIDSDGGVRWVAERGRGVINDRGECTHLDGVIIEVTKSKQIEHELKLYRDHLEELVAERTGEIIEANRHLENQILVCEQTEGMLRESEAQKKAILDSISVNMWFVNDALEILWANKAALEYVNKTPDQVKGGGTCDVWADMKKAGDDFPVIKALKTGNSEHAGISTPDGNVWDVKGEPVLDSDGKMLGVVGFAQNITERVRMEEMMIQAEKMLSVGGVAAGMAHEINNPLAGMLQSAQVILNRITKDLPVNRRAAEECGTTMESIQAFMEKRRIVIMLESIRNSGARAADIVHNMLSFSRRSDSEKVPVDLRELMDKTLELAESDYDLKKRYDFRHIDILRKYDPDLPRVACQPTKIQQVLLNLLKNGAESMFAKEDREGAPRFILRVMHENGMARIEVEDNGPGISEEIRKRVFEPFYTTKDVGMGTGLGLSVSYFIVTEDHGGTMAVESSPGKGATFIIRLPC